MGPSSGLACSFKIYFPLSLQPGDQSPDLSTVTMETQADLASQEPPPLLESALSSSKVPSFPDKDSLGHGMLAAALLKAKSQMVNPKLEMTK